MSAYISWSRIDWYKFLHPRQKFERQPFTNDWSYGIKNYRSQVTFNSTTSLLKFINILIGSKMLGGYTQTDRQNGDLISLTFPFKNIGQ
jgi:hypothetical protein